MVQGTCEDRFVRVRDVFAENFSERGDVGASVCLYLDGRPVVDLWGGSMDAAETRPWAEDTIVNVFSCGKGFVATAIMMLVERGVLELGAPVSAYWPEFGAKGKSAITLRDVLTHRSAVPGIKWPTLAVEDFWDVEKFVRLLAEEKPWWEPGTMHGYHAVTFGYVLGEIVARVTATTLGTWIAKEIAGPLGVDFHIGLGPEHDDRVADVINPSAETTNFLLQALELDDSMSSLALKNPSLVANYEIANLRQWREAEIPAANAHTNARSIARFYAMLADGGQLDGTRLLERDTLELMLEPHCEGVDAIVPRHVIWGLGMQVRLHEVLGLREKSTSFGHGGAGGSLGWADPEFGIAFGYAMNQLSNARPDPRGDALIAAVYESVEA